MAKKESIVDYLANLSERQLKTLQDEVSIKRDHRNFEAIKKLASKEIAALKERYKEIDNGSEFEIEIPFSGKIKIWAAMVWDGDEAVLDDSSVDFVADKNTPQYIFSMLNECDLDNSDIAYEIALKNDKMQAMNKDIKTFLKDLNGLAKKLKVPVERIEEMIGMNQ